MCDTRGHEHWCSYCSKNLNNVPADSYIEIEWSQNDKGQIVEEKSMICKSCLERSENIKELNKFFKDLEYPPWGHVFCSSCKKDITKEYNEKKKDDKITKKIKSKISSSIVEGPRPGIDYECLNFKCHEKSGKNIKHIIRVVVLCPDCMKKDFNAENIEKLKKLGRNPKFSPIIVCDKIDKCKQYKKGDKNVNCKHIVIGRDRETLQIGLLCSRKHKGALLLPFDDGFAIIKPKKGGAAAANPVNTIMASGTNPLQDYMVMIEKMFKKYKLGKFADPHVDYDAKIAILETRIKMLENTIGINDSVINSMAHINSPTDFVDSGYSPGSGRHVVSTVKIDNNKKNNKDKK